MYANFKGSDALTIRLTYSVKSGANVRAATGVGGQPVPNNSVGMNHIRTCADRFWIWRAEYVVFMPVGQIPCLCDVCGRNRRCESAIVNRLHCNIIVNLSKKKKKNML